MWIIRDYSLWTVKMVSEKNYKIGDLNRKSKYSILTDDDWKRLFQVMIRAFYLAIHLCIHMHPSVYLCSHSCMDSFIHSVSSSFLKWCFTNSYGSIHIIQNNKCSNKNCKGTRQYGRVNDWFCLEVGIRIWSEQTS